MLAFKEMKQKKIESRIAYEVACFLYGSISKLLPKGRGEKLVVNSFPKSGTHLLTTMMTYIPDYYFHGRHVKNYWVNELSKSPEGNSDFRLDCSRWNKILGDVKSGHFITTHLPYDEDIVSISAKNDFKVLNLIRDPRDLVLSEAHYIMGLKRHFLHKPLRERASDIDEAVIAILTGFEYEGGFCLSYAERLRNFSGWMKDSRVLSVKYEELIGEKRGGNDQTAADSINKILKMIDRQQDVEAEELLIKFQNKPSATMRKGVAKSWSSELKKSTIGKLHLELNPFIYELGYDVNDSA